MKKPVAVMLCCTALAVAPAAFAQSSSGMGGTDGSTGAGTTGSSGNGSSSSFSNPSAPLTPSQTEISEGALVNSPNLKPGSPHVSEMDNTGGGGDSNVGHAGSDGDSGTGGEGGDMGGAGEGSGTGSTGS